MESQLSNFCFSAVNSDQDFIDFLNSYFHSLEKFDDYLKILSFYHVKRCEHDGSSQCLFTVNLRYLYVEHCLQNKTDVKELINYCKMRKEQVITSRLFKILSLWNNRKEQLACVSAEPEPSPVISMGEFFKEITIDLCDRFALILFILNTLYLLKNGGY